MQNQRRFAALALAAVLGASSCTAIAADSGPVSVKVNMARILRISTPANTVIIGNPRIADVTIQDPQTLVLTGKSYGQTNMIVLDSQGNAIADTMVEVVQAQGDIVTVYMGSARTTMACAPVCQPTIMLGDDPSFSATSAASASVVAGQ
ncbi:MAG: pilus assembly protein N-terminal domain-containing protein [Alphaproteobacteria bacterium]|nr:pilus assembly protein N-terminal domain-containing protein [Alphaproteobacteria bacterium]